MVVVKIILKFKYLVMCGPRWKFQQACFSTLKGIATQKSLEYVINILRTGCKKISVL